jgi:hypothetical protein
MIKVHIIGTDAAARLAARSALERAGFLVSEAADVTIVPCARPKLVIVEPGADIAIIRRRYRAVRVLALTTAFTQSQLLAAVRLTLARPRPHRATAPLTGEGNTH